MFTYLQVVKKFKRIKNIDFSKKKETFSFAYKMIALALKAGLWSFLQLLRMFNKVEIINTSNSRGN